MTKDKIALAGVVIALVALFFATKPNFTWYQDADSDSYGNPDKSTWSLWQPEGYVENKSDCYDENAKVNPDQTQFFAEHRGDEYKSFDYNCDGKSEKELTVIGKCDRVSGNTIANPQGWWNGKIPEPGEAGDWLHDCDTRISLSGIEVVPETRRQVQKGR